jgi:hypothetical protein
MARDVTDPAAASQPPAHFRRNPPGSGDITIICETVHELRLDIVVRFP